MIHIFFDAGSFGSTIESVLHNYTDHSVPIKSEILEDGSMHSFHKEYHVTGAKILEDFLQEVVNDNAITTPNYPFKEFKLPAILEHFSQLASWKTDKKVLIYQPNLQASELNLLFKYHKVCFGKTIKQGLGVIVGEDNNQHNIVNWNSSYTHWSQMRPWEFREWVSMFYPGFVQETIDSQYQVSNEWLKLTNLDILYSTKESLLKIINHCGLKNTQSLDEFVTEWQKSQQYIVDEFNLLDQIVNHTIANRPLEWQPINVIAEAIVQQRLRAKGYEIRCDGLDIFPTSAIMFNTLLEKVHQ